MKITNLQTGDIYFGEKDQMLIDVLNQNNLFITAPCGGKGICGKCKLQLLPADTPVSPQDLKLLTSAELENGFRLACTFPLTQDISFFPPEEENGLVQIWKRTEDATFGIAVDIGTTTIEMVLVGCSGEKLAQLSMLNRQKSFGADVISRINYTIEHSDGLSVLHQILLHQINHMIDRLTEEYGCPKNAVKKAVVVANTTLIHLLLNRDPRSIAFYPFTPLLKEAQVLPPEALPIHAQEIDILPCISAYIGADITANMVYFDLEHTKKNILVVDIGTNGEMALAANGTILCCSTAAGPAFEGANISCGVGGVPGGVCRVWLEENRLRFHTIGNRDAVGLCGSGAIDLLAVLLELGIVDSSGYMADFSEVTSITGMKIYRQSIREVDNEKRIYLTDKVWLSAKDIREFQLAKSAVFSGMQILLREAGLAVPDRLIVTGGLGNHLNIESALRIGLFHPSLKEVIEVVENGALAGAVQCIDSAEFERSKRYENTCNYIELSTHPDFSELYIENMEF